jgi:1-deoxyxylulose-5-phosphate synthase
MQDHLNLLYREEEREMLPRCREEKIGVIPYSPLASGRLTRDWSKDRTLRSETDHIAKSKYDATAETDQQVVSRVAEIAEKYGVPRVHIALAWLLQKQPVTAPIIGATKITHLEDAVGALSVQLTHLSRSPSSTVGADGSARRIADHSTSLGSHNDNWGLW